MHSGRDKQKLSTMEERMGGSTLRSKLLLGVAAIGVVFLLAQSARSQESGETLFKSKCAMCHGPDGAGKTMMGEKLKIPDLHSDVVQKKTDAELTQTITKGKGSMPSNEGKLSKEQVVSLVGFVRDLGKKH
jgi:mono/diheme cytochrome c family protein